MPKWTRDGVQCEAMLECDTQCIDAAFARVRVTYPGSELEQWLCSYHQSRHRAAGARLRLVYRWSRKGSYEP